jgi:hypothetical protein
MFRGQSEYLKTNENDVHFSVPRSDVYKARETTVVQTAGTMHKALFGDIEQGRHRLYHLGHGRMLRVTRCGLVKWELLMR